MPNPLSNSLLRSTVETVVWAIDGGEQIVSLRNYTGGCYYEIYVNASVQASGHAKEANKPQKRKFQLSDGRTGFICTTFIFNVTY